MQCNVCGKQTTKAFNTTILGKYQIDYFECPNCKFIQTETPYWLKEAYASPINETDTGLLRRNIQFVPRVATLLFFLVGKDKYFVDYGGGYGVFTRLMRDVGFDYYWTDPHCDNIHARGFSWDKKNQPDAITLFETFEHFVDPRMEIRNLLKITKNIIFSTTLAPEPTPAPESWWYYGREHGQHTALYRASTFRFIANEENVHYTNFGNLHLFSEKPIRKGMALLLKKGPRITFPIISKFMKSKTFTDMQQIIENKSKK